MVVRRYRLASLILFSFTSGCIAQSPSLPLMEAPQPSRGLETSVARSSGDSVLPLAVVHTFVRVDASANVMATEHPSPLPFHAMARDILPSAGTYGDFSRYLQVLPGVVGNGDYSNDLIVRGGNPMENLYLVDGFEVPNISQISIQGTTGGISSMIDTAAIQGVDLYTGGYDASFDERLSSVVDIRTRPAEGAGRHGEFEAGYIGAGGLFLQPLGQKGSILGSVHQSFLNLIDKNIGLGGTPIYNNMLWVGEINPTPADQFNFLSLSGYDSLDMQPGGKGHNSAGTNQIDMQYSGWRTTNGLRWRHTYSPRSFGVLTVSDSEDQENIQQENTLFDILQITSKDARKVPPVLVYSQVSRDGRSSAKFDATWDSGERWSLIAGTAVDLNHVNYQIEQPQGEQSPLSVDPRATDADSFAPNFLSGETGSYAEVTYRAFPWWSLSGGGRIQTFALGGHWTATPRLNTRVQLSEHTALHAAFGEYAQMPPTVDVTAWPQNHFLQPIHVRHMVGGADLYTSRPLRIGVEVYQKDYRDYPVSTEFPTLSLANMVDDLGQQMLWIPLASRGSGRARGVEFSAAGHIGNRFTALVNVAYAHSEYAGLDGILRSGNFDYPVVGNTSGTYRTAKHYEVSWHFTYTSGRPYTPYLLQQSMAQNRPIYDMSQVNALRGPAYSRLDFEADRSFFLGGRRLVVYLGLDNALNHKNFLGYYWMAREDAYWGCRNNPQNCITEVDSFSIYPDGGVRYHF